MLNSKIENLTIYPKSERKKNTLISNQTRRNTLRTLVKLNQSTAALLSVLHWKNNQILDFNIFLGLDINDIVNFIVIELGWSVVKMQSCFWILDSVLAGALRVVEPVEF